MRKANKERKGTTLVDVHTYLYTTTCLQYRQHQSLGQKKAQIRLKMKKIKYKVQLKVNGRFSTTAMDAYDETLRSLDINPRIVNSLAKGIVQ